MADTRYVRGCCPLDCQDTCSWVAHVQNGKVVRVEGAPDHPFTRGTLCAKVNDYEARTYSPDRLLHPLRRRGPKGAGEFERVSWNEAVDTIADRFSDVIERFGPEAILPLNYLGSMGVVQRRALMRLFHLLGTSRFHGSICGASGNLLEAEGHPRGFDPEEIVDSQFIIVWGANILTTSHHHWYFIKEAKRRHGARIVCIDPRRTRTARACDEHVAIRPGTDHVLAAGMARVIVEEGLADLAYAEAVTSDLDLFREQVQPWTLDRVAEVCGVESETVVRLAREFGRARPATIRGGVGPQQTANGEAYVRSLSALAILGGHWKLPGGGLFLESVPRLHEGRAMGLDLIRGEPRSLDLARIGEHLTDQRLDPPVMALMVWNMNLAVDQPDVGRVREGLAREDLFTVVLEHFITDTARYADIVLPSTTQLEHFDIQGAWGHHYISLNHPAVAPLGESKSHGEVLRLLARRMGLTHPALQASDEEIAASALPEDVDLDALKATAWVKASPVRWTPATERLSIAAGVPPPVAPTAPGRLQLLTPKAHYFMNSSFANMPRQRRAMKRPILEMHPHDAEARGLGDGQKVAISNEQGTLQVWLRVTTDVVPGVVALPGKWWSFTEESDAVANVLTPGAWSPGGQPAYNDTFVDVTSVMPAGGDGERTAQAVYQ